MALPLPLSVLEGSGDGRLPPSPLPRASCELLRGVLSVSPADRWGGESVAVLDARSRSLRPNPLLVLTFPPSALIPDCEFVREPLSFLLFGASCNLNSSFLPLESL